MEEDIENFPIKIVEQENIPFLLQQIPKPPQRLYIQGNLPTETTKILCIVGARKHSIYGANIVRKLISGLKGYDISIVSGLAIGIDTLVHRAALETRLHTIAFPGSGLGPGVLYPAQNRRLAREILKSGGALVSEFEMEDKAAPWTFPQRNRLMAGSAHATIVIEADIVSGSLITSRLATEYNRDVGAVPGPIDTKFSKGPNMLIRIGATPITCSEDILELLGFERPVISIDEKETIVQRELLLNLTENERKLINILETGPHTYEQLVSKTEMEIREAHEALSLLEIQGLIQQIGGSFKIGNRY